MRFHQNLLLPWAILGFIAGCESAPSAYIPEEWLTISANGRFTFRAPPDLKPEPVRGYDSFVGRYVSHTFELTFDYGLYSDPLNKEGYTSREITVDGKSARLVTEGEVIAIHFPKVKGKTKLTMSVRLKNADAKTAETAETVLQSIDFP